MSRVAGNILFVKAPQEAFTASEDSSPAFTMLWDTLEERGYALKVSADGVSETLLDGVGILVAGIPEYQRGSLERTLVAEFLAKGGNVLLLTNAATMLNPPPCLNDVAALAGIQFQEYLNAPAPLITQFYPHWITANVRELMPGKIASLTLSAETILLAETDEPHEPFMACATVNTGRFVAIGNESWLRDDQLPTYDHLTLILNIFEWLGQQSALEIVNLDVPRTMTLEQPGYIKILLQNQDPEQRANFRCILDSDSGALVTQPVREKYGLPPHQVTEVQWQVHLQKLGKQKLRLIIDREDDNTLYFDHLPELYGVVSGYLTLEIKNNKDVLQTSFQTGEHFIVEGTFHATSPVTYSTSDTLQLKLSEGLVQRAFELGAYKSRWYVQATKAGSHQMELRLKGTTQSLPAQIHVQHSLQDQVEEIRAAIVCPLDAEIAARLRQIDPILGGSQVQNIPFSIVSPDAYITALYDGEPAVRLQGMLTAARREQWFNPNLLDIILTYFLPTHVPNQGVYIPYDPDLASSLADLHPSDRRYLENNLLCSKESSDIQIKQNVAAYLLHEKYGHGFFYTHTRLGRQLAILHQIAQHKALFQLLDDSTTIVNEGFATWMELTFLNRLGPEIRPVVTMRRDLLIERSKGLFERALRSKFFQQHPPRFDSPYREGFEYFDSIGRNYHPRCAVRVMQIASNIDLGVVEDKEHSIALQTSAEQIHQDVLDPEKVTTNSYQRLVRMAHLLRDNRQRFRQETKARHCPQECFEIGCPLEEAIGKEFHWRVT